VPATGTSATFTLADEDDVMTAGADPEEGGGEATTGKHNDFETARAWQRSAIHPGGEMALAAGIARVLLEEQLVQARGPMPPLTLAQSAEQSGLSTDAIRDLARLIVGRPPGNLTISELVR
jgi:hypothetical protein